MLSKIKKASVEPQKLQVSIVYEKREGRSLTSHQAEAQYNRDYEVSHEYGTPSPPVPGGEFMSKMEFSEAQRRKLLDKVMPEIGLFLIDLAERRHYDNSTVGSNALKLSNALSRGLPEPLEGSKHQKQARKAWWVRLNVKPFGFTFLLGGVYHRVSVKGKVTSKGATILVEESERMCGL